MKLTLRKTLNFPVLIFPTRSSLCGSFPPRRMSSPAPSASSYTTAANWPTPRTVCRSARNARPECCAGDPKAPASPAPVRIDAPAPLVRFFLSRRRIPAPASLLGGAHLGERLRESLGLPGGEQPVRGGIAGIELFDVDPGADPRASEHEG